MHELARPVHDLRLPALEVADEVPAEGVAVLGVLRLQILRPVLADHLDTGLGEDCHVGEGDVLVAATIVTPGPTSSRMRARFLRTTSGDEADHPLTARAAVVAPVREEQVGMARGAEVDALDVAQPLLAQRQLRRRPEIELAAAQDGGAEALGKRPRDVGASPRSSTARSPGRAQRRRAGPSARMPAATIPSSKPRHPAWRSASAGRSPFARATAIGTQSAVIFSIGSPGSSVHRPSPGRPR